MSAAIGEALGATELAAVATAATEAAVAAALAAGLEGAAGVIGVDATVSASGVCDHAMYPTPVAIRAAAPAPNHNDLRRTGGLPLGLDCSAERIFRSPSVVGFGVAPNSVGGPDAPGARESRGASTLSSSCFGAGRVGPDCRREALRRDSQRGTP